MAESKSPDRKSHSTDSAVSEFILRPKHVTLTLAIITLVLVVVHIVNVVFFAVFGRTFGLYFFSMVRERSIPGFYSSALMLACSILLLAIAVLSRRRSKGGFLYWAGMSILFIYLSIDEYIGIHEKLSAPVREALNTSSYLKLAWIIPYTGLILIVILVYFRFLVRLPPRTRFMIIFAGIIYVTGAIGLELVSGQMDALYGHGSFAYHAAITAEETSEIVGILVFFHALMTYASEALGGVGFIFSAQKT